MSGVRDWWESIGDRHEPTFWHHPGQRAREQTELCFQIREIDGRELTVARLEGDTDGEWLESTLAICATDGEVVDR